MRFPPAARTLLLLLLLACGATVFIDANAGHSINPHLATQAKFCPSTHTQHTHNIQLTQRAHQHPSHTTGGGGGSRRGTHTACATQPARGSQRIDVANDIAILVLRKTERARLTRRRKAHPRSCAPLLTCGMSTTHVHGRVHLSNTHKPYQCPRAVTQPASCVAAIPVVHCRILPTRSRTRTHTHAPQPPSIGGAPSHPLGAPLGRVFPLWSHGCTAYRLQARACRSWWIVRAYPARTAALPAPEPVPPWRPCHTLSAHGSSVPSLSSLS